MPFGPEDVFFAQCPPNNKTTVENKAYNLSNGVTKGRWLMTPKTGSRHAHACTHTHTHTHTQLFMER